MRIPATSLKAIITAYIGHLSNRQWDQLPGYFTPNATWWTSGNPALVDQAGTTSASDHLPALSQLADMFSTYSFDIVNIIGEGDRVMLEGQAVGKGPQDLVYVNNITMSFKMTEQGKICDLREYPDHVEINWLLQWIDDHSNSTTTK
ncbi:hypothetical protein F5Y15DRAFT_384862 [Xylariaceae sp. FL0016]|nr:hypothetical protein F5Y15DRAFT_384862 [Xylariaceae sp. FL0016]